MEAVHSPRPLLGQSQRFCLNGFLSPVIILFRHRKPAFLATGKVFNKIEPYCPNCKNLDTTSKVHDGPFHINETDLSLS